MANYKITREFGAVYLTDNLLTPPQMTHPQKKLFKVGQIISAREATPQEITQYGVVPSSQLISSDNWIVYKNAVEKWSTPPLDQFMNPDPNPLPSEPASKNLSGLAKFGIGVAIVLVIVGVLKSFKVF